MKPGLPPLGLVLVIAGLIWPGGSSGEVLPLSKEATVARFAPSILPIEAVLETRYQYSGQGEKQESRVELQGALVDEEGLIMISASAISAGRMREIAESMGNQEFGFDLTPLSFRVLLRPGEEEVDAILAATDSTLDLAFLSLDRRPPEGREPIHFDPGPGPSLGDEVFSVVRLGGGFDFAPTLQSARIGGRLSRPLSAWILDGRLSGLGLPVFDDAGRPIGVLTTLFSPAASDVSGQAFSMGSFLGGAGLAGDQIGPLGVFVVPADRVARLIVQARTQAAELRRRASAEAQAESEATETPTRP